MICLDIPLEWEEEHLFNDKKFIKNFILSINYIKDMPNLLYQLIIFKSLLLRGFGVLGFWGLAENSKRSNSEMKDIICSLDV